MDGKSMRCPNLECRQVFAVKAMEEKGPEAVYELPPEPTPEPPPPTAKPPKPSKPGSNKPPASSVPPHRASHGGSQRPPKPTRTKSAGPEVGDAGVVEAAVVSPPKVKEVVWSEGTDVPPPAKGRKSSEPEDEAPDDLPVRRRKRKHSRGPLVLAIMLVGIVAAVGFGAFYVLYFQTK